MMMRLVIRGSFSSCIVWAVSVAALPTQTNLHRGTHDDCQNQHQGRHEARRRPEATVSAPQYSHRPLSSDPRREGAVVVYEPLQVNNAVCPKRDLEKGTPPRFFGLHRCVLFEMPSPARCVPSANTCY